MIEETAQVVALDGADLLLQTQRQSTCGSCAVKSGCGTSVVAGIVGQKITRLKVRNTLGAKPGDTVLLGLQEQALVTGSLLVYVLPLLLMLAGALGGEALASAWGMDPELMPVVGAALAFALSLLLVRRVLQKAAIGMQLQPVLLRILTRAAHATDLGSL